jgi:hypothetical protein
LAVVLEKSLEIRECKHKGIILVDTMAAPDLDIIKDVPGYKVILKAVLKSQIQQLVSLLF